MYENPYASSLEAKILSATPMELVKLLFEAAIEAVQAARRHLACGEIMERGRAVSKAVGILAELSGSLDREKGGELSVQLAALYDYLQRTLLDANFRQADDGFEKAEQLLKTLGEAWSAIANPRSNASADSSTASQFVAANPDGSEGFAHRSSQQWCA